MKFSVAVALISLLGSGWALPTSSNTVARRDNDGHEAAKDHRDDGEGYDHNQDKAHYPDNLEHYPNKHCDVRYQNFLDLLLDDVCAKFYEGDRKHNDMEYSDDKKHKRDGKDYGRDDGHDAKTCMECDDRADKLLDEACRAYYHYDDGKKDHEREQGKGKDYEQKEEHVDQDYKEDKKHDAGQQHDGGDDKKGDDRH